MVGQFVNFFSQAAGGQRDVPHTDVQSVGAVDQLQKAEHRVEVVQRLPNAHEHDVADRGSGVHLGEKHLIQHLSGC